MSGRYAFVMMIRNKWWSEFRHYDHRGKEIQAYVQKGAAPPEETSLILFYVTKPVGEIAGYAEFIERKVGDTGELWKQFGEESVLGSKEKYEEFLGGARKASFIRFKNLHEAAQPIPLSNVLMLLGVRRLSRKGFYIDKETADEFLALMGCGI